MLRSFALCLVLIPVAFGAPAPTKAQTVRNGGFDDTNNSFVQGTPGGFAPNGQIAPDWTAANITPDWDRAPGTAGAGYTQTVPGSSDGAYWMGMLGLDGQNDGEAISQQIGGFQQGKRYQVIFEYIGLPSDTTQNKTRPNGAYNDDGYLEVTMFGQTKRTPLIAGDSNIWLPIRLDFVANATNTTLEFKARDAILGNGFQAYIGVDGVSISPLDPPIPGTCLDLSHIATGTRYATGSAIPGQGGYIVSVEPFTDPSGTLDRSGGLVVYTSRGAGGTPQPSSVYADRANARVHLRSSAQAMIVQFAHVGNFANLSVNGARIGAARLSNLHGQVLGGAKLEIYAQGWGGGETGVLSVLGAVNAFSIGADEMWLGVICAR